MNCSDLNQSSSAGFTKANASFDIKRFWRKIPHVARKAGRALLVQALTLFYAYTNPTTTLKDRILIAGALGYLICPFDLIPDFLGLPGYVDDGVALMTCITTLGEAITPEIKHRAECKADETFGG